MNYYELHFNMLANDLTGGWYGTNQDGMFSDDGVFRFVFVPGEGLITPVTFAYEAAPECAGDYWPMMLDYEIKQIVDAALGGDDE